MKNFIKLLSAVIALVTVLTAVCSCQPGKTPDKDEETTVSSGNNSDNESATIPEGSSGEAVSSSEESTAEEGGKYETNIEKKNYNADFNVLTLKDMFPADYFFTSENTFDDMTDAVYTRMQNVNDHLGIELISIDAGTFDQYAETVKISSKNNDNTYSLVLTHVYQGLASLVLDNYLYDFNDLESVNVNAPYWNTDLMEELAIDEKMYLGYSDFNLAYVYVVVFNKTIYEDLMNSEEIEGKTVYQYVNDYEWTIDKMFEIASVGARENGDKTWDEKDTYGFSGQCWVEMCNFLQSSNIQIITRNESGNYSLTFTDTNQFNKTNTLIEKLREYYNAEYTYLWPHTEAEDKKVHMESGQTLFEMSFTYKLKDLTNYDVKFGVLPYPMYDTAQKDAGGYRELNWGGFMAIPNVESANYDMIGDTVELLSYYSEPVTISFYETLLGKKIAEAPEDSKMLKLVWASVCSDVGLTYSNIGGSALDPYVYAIPRCILENKSFSSYSKSYNRSAVKIIQNLLNK